MARHSEIVANVTRLVMFWGLLGQQWTSGLRVQLSAMQMENFGPDSGYYIHMSEWCNCYN